MTSKKYDSINDVNKDHVSHHSTNSPINIQLEIPSDDDTASLDTSPFGDDQHKSFQSRVEKMMNTHRYHPNAILPSRRAEMHENLCNDKEVETSSEEVKEPPDLSLKGLYRRAGNFFLKEIRYAKSFSKRSHHRSAPKQYDYMSDREKHFVRWMLTDLAYALTVYGASAQSVEYNLSLISIYYGLRATFTVTPFGVWITFNPHRSLMEESNHYPKKKRKETTSTEFIKVGGTDIDIGKVSDLHQLCEDIMSGRFKSPRLAHNQVKNIVNESSRYDNFLIREISSILQSYIGIVLLSGTRGEIIAGMVAGILAGLLKISSDYIHNVGKNLVPLLCALTGGAVGLLAKYIFEKKYDMFAVDTLLVVEAGVFILLPDIEFVIATSELNVMNIMSGVLRIASVAVVTAQLLFGALSSGFISRLVFGKESQESIQREEFPTWILALLIPFNSFANMISLHIPFRVIAVFFVTIVSYAAFFVSKYLTMYIGHELGTVIAAFIIGIIGNIYAGITKQPNIIVLAVGAQMLVPGVVSNQSVRAMLENETVLGIQIITSALIITTGLVIGLMSADFVMYFASPQEYL